MTIIIRTTCFACIAISLALAAPPRLLGQVAVEWARELEGFGFEYGVDVQQAMGGGYIAAGTTSQVISSEGSRIILIRTSAAGEVTWKHRYGSSDFAFARSVKETSDGYVVAGTQGISQEWDAYVIKIDSQGVVSWERAYGDDGLDSAEFIEPVREGGFIVAGESVGRAFLIRIDDLGNVIWQRTYSAGDGSRARCVRQTADGGFALVGIVMSLQDGYWDFLLVKTDPEGKLLWKKEFGGFYHQEASALAMVPGGGFLLAGRSFRTSGNGTDVYLVRTDEFGTMVWDRRYPDAGNGEILSITPSRDGMFVMAGRTIEGEQSHTKLLALKVKDSGDVDWQVVHGAAPELGAVSVGAQSVAPTRDGGFVLTGTYNFFGNRRIWLVKLSPDAEGPAFHRGDCNSDGALDISDGLCCLSYLFSGTRTPSCLEAVDANNDGAVDCSDGIHVLSYIFLGTEAPLTPGPPPLACGQDPDLPGSLMDLGCASYEPCSKDS